MKSKRRHERKRPRRRPRYSKLVIGITDLTREEWEKLRERSEDGAGGYETYESWLAAQEKAIRNLRKLGYEPLKVPIKVAELEQWLAQESLPNTSESRARYVALAVRGMVQGRRRGSSSDSPDQ